jgi:Xaa-Pro aminopeptidase
MSEPQVDVTSEPSDTQPETASHDIPMAEHLKQALSQDWDPAPAMPHPGRPDGAPHTARRRAALSAEFRGRTMVVPAGGLKVRANDTDYPFRAASALTWLTGETEAGAVLVMTPSGDSHRATLYIGVYAQPGEPAYFTSRTHGAVWVGNVPSVEGTAATLGLEVRPRSELSAALEAARGGETVVLRGVDAEIDRLLPGSSGDELARVIDELRLVKDDWEVGRLRLACEATARGFADVVREIPAVLDRPDVRGERWLEGTFWRRARLEGNEVGYTSIVAGGPHATTLHWWRNSGALASGDLLLADMGIETDELYTADVTRTLPLSGEWSPEQLKVYRAVQEAQAAGVAEVKAGADFLAAGRAAHYVLADHLHSWGLLPVPAEVACDLDEERPGAGLHRRWTLHGVSHHLGIDVHDCARAREERYRQGTLQAGMVITVEPGLYFQPNDRAVPPELRGIGVRIEDDVLVTDGEPVNLSDGLPRDPDEVVAWMREAQASTPLE